jgi:hypothetical protein
VELAPQADRPRMPIRAQELITYFMIGFLGFEQSSLNEISDSNDGSNYHPLRGLYKLVYKQ